MIDAAGTEARGVPGWVRWWVGVVGALSLVGVVLPRVIGEGAAVDRGRVQDSGAADARTGCPRSLDVLAPTAKLPRRSGGSLVPDAPQAAVVCRYPVLSDDRPEAALVDAWPSTDPARLAARFRALSVSRADDTRIHPCGGRLPADHTIVLFTYDTGTQHSVYVDPLCRSVGSGTRWSHPAPDQFAALTHDLR